MPLAKTCGDCGAREGEIHMQYCDQEACPKCGGQLISCGCSKAWPTKSKRIPYIQYPNLCCYCGGLWPRMFMVSDKEWKRYIEPSHRRDMVCLRCWNHIKSVIDRERPTPEPPQEKASTAKISLDNQP